MEYRRLALIVFFGAFWVCGAFATAGTGVNVVSSKSYVDSVDATKQDKLSGAYSDCAASCASSCGSNNAAANRTALFTAE